MRNDPQAVMADFHQPPAQFRPIMHWVWNGPITRALIRDHLVEFKAKGLGGVVLWPISGRKSAGTFGAVEPRYLSDEYLALVRYAAEIARREGLYLWILDEAGWPSGYADGEVMDGHPEYFAQVLRIETVPATEVTARPADCVCAVAIMGDSGSRLLDSEDILSVPTGATHVCFAVVRRILPDSPGASERPDTLNPAAIRRFIDLTHERYYRACGEFFGNTIPGFFTDETYAYGHTGTAEIPFTDGIFEQFQRRKGFDIRSHLPLLFSAAAVGAELAAKWDEQTVVSLRCEYLDVVAQLFEEAYWGQITAWCTEHGVVHTGHVGGEDNLPDHHCFKDIGRTVGALTGPGVDAIWRQVWPHKENFPFPVFASSAARFRPAWKTLAGTVWENMLMSESYAVYGYGLTFWQMRWVADWQYLFGVNLLMPMHVQTKTADGKFTFTFQHIGRGNPFWRYYSDFSDYIGRLSAVMRRANARADIAIYYPIEVVWTDSGGPKEKAAWDCLQELCRRLNETQVAFDFLDAQAVRKATVTGQGLEIAGEIYRTVIIPNTPILPSDVAAKLRELHDAGGRIFFCGMVPKFSSDWQGQERLSAALAELSAVVAIPELVRIIRIIAAETGRPGIHPLVPTPELLLSVRRLGYLTAHFLLNTVDRTLPVQLGLGGDELLLERWDATSGAMEPLTPRDHPDGTRSVQLELPPFGSALVMTRPLSDGVRPLTTADSQSPEAVVARWTVANRVEMVEVVVIQDGDIVSREDLRRPIGEHVPLQPWSELGLGNFSGTVAYHLDLDLSQEHIRDSRLSLRLPEVCYAAEVAVNGQSAGRILWAPHELDITDFLMVGGNHLIVSVSNSLVNQVLDKGVIAEAQVKDWVAVYFKICKEFMAESLRSGLIGEIQVVRASKRLHLS